MSPDDALIFPSLSHQVVIEAEFDASGKLTCASPLSGISIYWPYAIQALSQPPKDAKQLGPGKLIVVFSGPAGHALRDSQLLIPRCWATQALQVLLRNGEVLESRNKNDEARKCYTLALNLAPNSVAANFGLALVESRLRHPDAALRHSHKISSLRPQFYEARINEALEYRSAGRPDQEEAIFKAILAGHPPLPVQENVLFMLTAHYDRRGQRAEALESTQSFLRVLRDLRSRYSALPLVSDFFMSFFTGDLALRLEEQKQYREAERAYSEAVDFALKPDSKASEAYRFELEMGRSRSLRRLGEDSAANSICSTWKVRLEKLGSAMNDFHWQGEKLARAKWELSCGDFVRGLKMLGKVAKQYANGPDHGDPYWAEAPYHALEAAYRARGEPEQARMAGEAADRIQSERSARARSEIFREVRPLFRENK